MNAYEIVRKAIPEADDRIADFIIWNRTPYPVGKVSAKDIYKAASRVRRAYDNRIKLCELCDNKAEERKYTCKRCEAALGEVCK